MRSILPVLAIVLFAASVVGVAPVASAGQLPVGVCIENHSPCAWDQLACVYTTGSPKEKVCVPDIS